MKRLLLVLPLVLGSLWMGPSIAFGNGLTCPAGDHRDIGNTGYSTVWFVGYESPNFNVGADANKNSTLCLWWNTTQSYGEPNLKDVPLFSSEDSICEGQLATSWGTWNDCISSFKVYLDCHHAFSLYADANYSGVLYSFSDTGTFTRATMPFGWDNAASSLRLTYHTLCGGAPAP